MSKATFPETTGNESQKPLMDGAVVSSDMRNALSSLFQGDIAPLRTRAQSTPNMTVAVNAAVVQNFFKQVNRGKQPVSFTGGNSPSITTPTSNPRIDILYLNNSGTLVWIAGSEAASPSANWTSLPDDGIPICTVYCRVGMTGIVNFEDSSANPTQGYIYEDVRPLITMGGGSVKEIKDNDSDTKIEVEQSADEDKVRITTAGTQRALIDSNGMALQSGIDVNEFSTDGTLGGNSDDAVPTEKAVKTYIDGLITSKHAFLVTKSGLQTNITADGYNKLITLDTEILDQGNNFASSQFTAPVSGFYQLSMNMGIIRYLDSAAAEIRVQIITSNRIFGCRIDPSKFSGDLNTSSFNISILADMDAGDTAACYYYTV